MQQQEHEDGGVWISESTQRPLELAQVGETLLRDRRVDTLEHVAIPITYAISVGRCFAHRMNMTLLMKTIHGYSHVDEFSSERGVSKVLATKLTVPK